MGSELSGAMSSAEANFSQMLSAQTQMQNAAMNFQMQSTVEKMKFDTTKSGIERIASVAESMSQMTDQQSQQIAR